MIKEINKNIYLNLLTVCILLFPCSLLSQIQIDDSVYTVEQCAAMANQLNETKQYREATNFLNQAANHLWETKSYDQAIIFYEKSIEINNKIGNSSGVARIESNLGMIYADMGSYEKALYYFDRTLQMRKQEHQHLPIISALVNMSVVLNRLERYNESLTHLHSALKLAGEVNDKDQMRSCYGLLAETYEKKGDQKQSKTYFDYYRALQENIQKDKERKIEQALIKVQKDIVLTQAEKEEKEVLLKLSEKELSNKQAELTQIDATNKQLKEQADAASLQIQLLEKIEAINTLTHIKVEQELAQEKQLTNLVVMALFISFLFLCFVGYSLHKITRMNILLSERNEIIIGQKERLEEENRVRTKLLSILSHDLRTPLSGVHLIVQLMRSKSLPPEMLDQQLAKLDKSLESSFQMLENMLFWAKSQLNGSTSKPETIDINELCTFNIKMLLDTIQQKNITIDQQVNTSEKILADREKISSIIRNLIVNAIKFTPPGGKITVKSKQLLDKIVLSIADTGIGIPKELQSKIFTTGMKSSVGTHKETGSGLGLVLCSDFAKSCGGSIRFESKEGQGTCFFLELPLITK